MHFFFIYLAETLIKKNYIQYKISQYILKVIIFVFNIIKAILINFVIIFNSYSLLILGLKEKEYNKELIFKLIVNFFILLSLSYITNISRLYIF
jgi:hypothetical protein